jgi:predicted Fe-Mo cluster-binding NifX family protein
MAERIAITVTTLSDLTAPMDPRFGRAAGFLVLQDGEILAKLHNSSLNASHGAGTGAASLMAEHGVGTVISGAFGPKAHAALTELGITMLIAPAGLTAAEALAKAQHGELKSQTMRVFR